MNHTLGRHKRLYGLLKETHTQEVRHDLVEKFSHGRTSDSSELSDLEVDELNRYLQQLLAPKSRAPHPTHSGVDYMGQQMRRRILSLCYTIGWVVWDQTTQKHAIDWSRLNSWLLKYGYLHKPLNDYTYTELQRLIVQFENMSEDILSPSR